MSSVQTHVLFNQSKLLNCLIEQKISFLRKQRINEHCASSFLDTKGNEKYFKDKFNVYQKLENGIFDLVLSNKNILPVIPASVRLCQILTLNDEPMTEAFIGKYGRYFVMIFRFSNFEKVLKQQQFSGTPIKVLPSVATVGWLKLGRKYFRD